MINRTIKYIFILLFLSGTVAKAQDPHFSQFFMAPESVNPALIGTMLESGWKVMSNYRQQWGSSGTPYNTFTLGAASKIYNKQSIGNTLYGSVQLMTDETMSGAFKSTYITSGLADFQNLDENNSIGIGFNLSYGQRTIDYSKLNFGEQFTSGGFNAGLPTGETALGIMKSFLSLSTGLMYSYQSDYFKLDAGLAVFNLNSPKQSFLSDPNQSLPRRLAVNVNLEYALSDQLMLNMNTVFQSQSMVSYLNTGGSVGFDLSGGRRENILYTGLWYRVGDAFIPYLGLHYDNVLFGLSYDVAASNKLTGSVNPSSYEFSLIFSKKRTNPGIIRCPWK